MITSALKSHISLNLPVVHKAMFCFSFHTNQSTSVCGYKNRLLTSTSLFFIPHTPTTLKCKPKPSCTLIPPPAPSIISLRLLPFLPHPRSADWVSVAGWWPPPGCWWCCSCPWGAGGMTLAGPSSGGGAGRGASSAGPGTGRPAAAAAGSGSTAPEKSASGTSPLTGETLSAGQNRSTRVQSLT